MKKSISASAISIALKLRYKPSEEAAEKRLEDEYWRGEKPYRPPVFVRPKVLRTERGDVYILNREKNSDVAVFYIHGGGYEHNFSPFHWKFIKETADHTGALMIVPAYKLLPYGDYRDAFRFIAPLYKGYVRRHPNKKIVMMGDSAGGGLALSLTLYFKEKNIKLPDELILFSPWVDVSMENERISEYAPRDPWLPLPWLKVCGRRWAEGTDIHDYKVSPTFGDLKGLKNVTVFLGTEEVLYPDVTAFFKKLDDDGTNELVIKEGLYHVYPLMPIAEAKEAKKMVYEKILR